MLINSARARSTAIYSRDDQRTQHTGNSKIEEYFKMSAKIPRDVSNALSAAYGDIVKPYLSDLSVIVQGIVQSYQNLFIFNELDIDFTNLRIYYEKNR
ncbi:hypothetical protein PO124_14215 [Bacillus licheniformis]|nr:hypothetical protein [Bacillus licheniformis]